MCKSLHVAVNVYINSQTTVFLKHLSWQLDNCAAIWNSLPFDIRNSCSIASFRRKLKTFFFQRLAMSNAPPYSSPQRLRFGELLVDIVRFIN